MWWSMFGNGITSGPPEISNASGTQSPRREEEELLGSTSNRFRIDKRDVSGPSKSTIVDDVVNEALHGPRTLKEKVRAISRRFFRLYMSVWNWILFGGKVGLLFWIFVQSYLVMTRMEAMLQLLIGGNDGTLVEYKAFFGQKMIMYREPSENPWDTYLVLLLYVVTVINRLAGFLFSFVFPVSLFIIAKNIQKFYCRIKKKNELGPDPSTKLQNKLFLQN